MKRASTGNEAKRSSSANSGRASSANLSTSQRMAAAGSEAIEAHARVRWLADRLGEELEGTPHDVPEDIGPEASMAAAVEKAASTMKAVTASMAAVSSSSTGPTGLGGSTKLGVGAPSNKPVVKTKLGIGTGSRNKPGDK
jgi:hypothetical protein